MRLADPVGNSSSWRGGVRWCGVSAFVSCIYYQNRYWRAEARTLALDAELQAKSGICFVVVN